MGTLPHLCGFPILGEPHESGKQVRVNPRRAFEAFGPELQNAMCILRYANSLFLLLSLSLSHPISVFPLPIQPLCVLPRWRSHVYPHRILQILEDRLDKPL